MSATTWQAFERDPRLPQHAPLRASDADRGVVQQILTESFVDGRLDRGEYDERSDRALGARTLGELPSLVDDLIPDPHVLALRAALDPATLRSNAVAHYAKERREAIFAFLTPNLICWAIWAAIALGPGTPFLWPIFVTIGTGLHLLRVLTSREEMVAKEIARQQKKALKRSRR